MFEQWPRQDEGRRSEAEQAIADQKCECLECCEALLNRFSWSVSLRLERTRCSICQKLVPFTTVFSLPMLKRDTAPNLFDRRYEIMGAPILDPDSSPDTEEAIYHLAVVFSSGPPRIRNVRSMKPFVERAPHPA